MDQDRSYNILRGIQEPIQLHGGGREAVVRVSESDL